MPPSHQSPLLILQVTMLLDPFETASLNRLIARQMRCNSSEDSQSIGKLVLCRSINRGLKYDLDSAANTTWPAQWSYGTKPPTATTDPSSSVYRIFYSNSSDSIIYIMAVLCIYFLLFTLLIYANWTSFNTNRRRSSTKSRRRRVRHRLFGPRWPSTVVCLDDCAVDKWELLSSDREPRRTDATTTLLLDKRVQLV